MWTFRGAALCAVSLATVSSAQAAMPSGSLVRGKLGERADSAIRVFERAGFSGVVRIAKGDTTLIDKGYGLANRAAGVAFAPTTIVQIGSNTKDFTATAILQLNERGLLSLDDSIGRFFPEAPADKRAITIRQVMEHRAGFPDFVSPPEVKNADFEPVGRDEFLTRLMRRELVAPPGTRFIYSNAGYSLLAALIERLTHESFDAYVQAHILGPLGMTNTGFALPRFDEGRLSHGYRNGTDVGTIIGHPHPEDGPYWNLRGNGGMSSTLDEMHTFYTALFTTEKLLTARTREQFFHANEPVSLAGSDGVSFFIYERYPRLGFEVIIASNNAQSPAPPVRRALVRALGLPSDDDGPGLRDVGDGVDLHAKPVAGERGRLNGGAGGTVLAEHARVDGVHLGELLHVEQKDAAAQHVLEI